MNVCVLQADNRPTLDYLLKTQKVNKKFCDLLGYTYLFVDLNTIPSNLHPATKKIILVNNMLQSNVDVLVFLDSDAWIQNGYWLHEIIHTNEKHGCFSRDPYLKKNTFINSGSFILKNNNFTKAMYKSILADLYKNDKHHHVWPYDQYYISKYVFENKEHFTIFVPDILNTPNGKVLRHNWDKNEKMYQDLKAIKFEKGVWSDAAYDEKVFPNL